VGHEWGNKQGKISGAEWGKSGAINTSAEPDFHLLFIDFKVICKHTKGCQKI
jgi:hypothetical protein